jgi:hypothetical protein
VTAEALAVFLVEEFALQPFLFGVRLGEEVRVEPGAVFTEPADLCSAQGEAEGRPGDPYRDGGGGGDGSDAVVPARARASRPGR